MTRLLSQRLRNHRLFLLDNGEGGGTGTAVAEPAAPVADPATPAADPAASGGANPGTVTLSQADLDKLIAKAHSKGAATADKTIKDYLAAESLSGEQKIAAERDAAIARADAASAEALQSRVDVSAEREALTAKVDPSKVERFLRLVDLKLDDVTTDGKPDAESIKAAVAKTIADFPEFATGAVAPTAGASGSQHQPPADGKIWTRAEVARISGTPEFEKNEAEIMRQMQAGLIK